MFSSRSPWRSWWIKSGSLVFVWSVWAVLAVCLVNFVHIYGVNLPYYDEWEMVPVLTGHQPITLRWLWSQHNEHRIFVGRLIYLAVLQIAGLDFRAGMYFTVLCLIGFSAMLLERVRRLRGSQKYSDAFFPLVLMNLGQAQNLIWSFQVTFLASTAAALGVLMILIARGRIGLPAALAAGACTIFLVPIGGNGLALAPLFSAIVFLMACELRKANPTGWMKPTLVGGAAALALVLVGLYFVNYEQPAKHQANSGLGAVLGGAAQFLATGLGCGVRFLWPGTGSWLLWFAVIATSAALAWTFLRRPEDRFRTARLALFLGAFGCLALGTSWARSAFASLFESRYATLASPFWCGCYFVWELVGIEKLRRTAQTSLFLIAAMLAFVNRTEGHAEGERRHALLSSVVAEIDAGHSLQAIISHRGRKIYYGEPGVLAERMKMLRQKQIGSCASLKD